MRLFPQTALAYCTTAKQFREWAKGNEDLYTFIAERSKTGDLKTYIQHMNVDEWRRMLRNFLSQKRNPADIPAKYILDPSLPLPKGMTRRQAKRVAELREAYQWSMARRFERVKLNEASVVAQYLIPILAPLHVEHMMVLPLDSSCKLIEAPHPVTRGDVDGCDAGSRAVLRAALIAGAVQFIIAHNHPAGSLEPSAADRAVTRRLAEGGRAIDCPLRDHIIIAPPSGWTSLYGTDSSLFR